MLSRKRLHSRTARRESLPLGRIALITRRDFLDSTAKVSAGMAIASAAKSYGQIIGANDRLNFAVIGLHGRAGAHLSSLKANKSAARIAYVCVHGEDPMPGVIESIAYMRGVLTGVGYLNA
jgi:hypothetical protein